MFVGVCEVDLYISESGSLKEKRFVLQSLKTRIRQKFNVSVAEVGGNDKWQRATLGFSMVANERKILDQTFQKILLYIETDGRSEILEHSVDVF